MRLGVVGPLHPDSFADNVLDTLRQMGHDGTHLGAAGTFSTGWIGRQSSRVLSQVPPYVRARQKAIGRAAENLDLDLVINLDGQLLPEVIEALQRCAGKVVLWFPDAIVNLGRMLMFLAPYDALFFKEPHLVERCQALLEVDVGYLPEACNPRWHKPPVDLPQIDPQVVVAGNIYGFRAVLLERLLDAGLPLTIYGGPIASFIGRPRVSELHSGEHISRQRKAQVFASAAAVLNSLHPAEFHGMNCRLFEGTACGGLVVTESRTELHRFFEEGDEVLSYSRFDELVEQLRWALENPEQSRGIRAAASKRAHSDHTYRDRLEQLFERVT